MFLHKVFALAGLITLVLSAALHPARQVSSAQLNPVQPVCGVATIYSYITVTTTDYPDTVTVAVPDYSAISSSLSSASVVDSVYVVHQSQDRPVLQPPDTRIPTFIESIYAPAVEVTEVPHTGGSAIYLPGTRPVQTVVIGTTTQTILFSFNTQPVDPTNVAQSSTQAVTGSPKTFTMPAGGWNGTNYNATDISPGTATGVGGTGVSTVTQTTYVSTTTFVTNTTITPVPTYGSASLPESSGYGGYGEKAKRQTCVLISANINDHWVSWCNNWDGSTTLTFVSWETTTTPGVVQGPSSTVSPTLSSRITSTYWSTTTFVVMGPLRTCTKSFDQVSSPNATESTLAPTAVPSMPPPSCGETGPFNIGFDDLPKQSVFDNATAALPPIFSPFEHFYWADGWSYLPPPNGPYPAHNGGQLAIYVPPSQPQVVSNPDLSYIPPGGFGAGQRGIFSAYWFDIHSAWVGCDNNATDPSGNCDFVAEGYRYDAQTNHNRLVFTQHYLLPLCHSTSCQLQQILFGSQASNLTTVSFYAKIGADVRTFYMDDVQLSWSNNTCEAGSVRASGRK